MQQYIYDTQHAQQAGDYNQDVPPSRPESFESSHGEVPDRPGQRGRNLYSQPPNQPQAHWEGGRDVRDTGEYNANFNTSSSSASNSSGGLEMRPVRGRVDRQRTGQVQNTANTACSYQQYQEQFEQPSTSASQEYQYQYQSQPGMNYTEQQVFPAEPPMTMPAAPPAAELRDRHRSSHQHPHSSGHRHTASGRRHHSSGHRHRDSSRNDSSGCC